MLVGVQDNIAVMLAASREYEKDEIRQFVQLDDTAPAFGGIPIMVRFFNVLKGVAWCYICVFQIFFADPVQLPPVLDEAVYIANLGNKSAI